MRGAGDPGDMSRLPPHRHWSRRTARREKCILSGGGGRRVGALCSFETVGVCTLLSDKTEEKKEAHKDRVERQHTNELAVEGGKKRLCAFIVL